MDSFGGGLSGGAPIIQLVYSNSTKQLTGIISNIQHIGKDELEVVKSSTLKQPSANNRSEHHNTEFKTIKTAVNYVPEMNDFDNVKRVSIFAEGQMDENNHMISHEVPDYALVLFNDFTASICKKEFACTVCDE